MASALDGITIVDLTDGPAGALATMFLGEHGARVIRLLDCQDTRPRRGGFLVWDRGKERTRLDFTRLAPGSAESETTSYERLLRGADVLIEDFAPASPRQTLVNDDWLSTLNPGLIHCSITAYGKHGPLKDEPPIDDLVMARLGILGSQPGFRPAPVHVVHPLPSVGAAIFAAQGIAAALLVRQKTGLGLSVETSLMAGALLYHPKVTGEKLVPGPFQTHPSGSAPFYSVYECADGNWLQLGCVHVGFVSTAATVMGITEVLQEPRFNRGRPPQDSEADAELRTIVAQALKTKPYAAWAGLFDSADVPFAQARLTEESLDDPQVQVNQMVLQLEDPEVGPLVQMGVAVQLSATPGRVQGPRRLTDTPIEALALHNVAPAPVRLTGGQLCEPPLHGIRVLEITNLIAGPTAARLLADLGADVIKFEPLDGDMSRPIGRTYFFNLNANKRSMSVNTRTPEGKEVVQKLAASADVLLANMRPGATERMGIGPEMLQQLNPRLIETHVTGYGWSGPYAHRPGIDPLAQALMGLQRAQGGPDNPPSFPSQLAPTDFTTGAMGTLGTILALYVRERTGIVQRVDSNLLNGGVILSSEWFTRYTGKPPRRLADRWQYGLDAFHRLYQARDGWLYLAADSPADQQKLFQALGRADLASVSSAAPAGGHANEAPLAQELARLFAGLSLAESLTRLHAAGVPCAPALPGDSEIFFNEPQAVVNDMVAVQQHPVLAKMHIAGHYIHFSDMARVPGRATPLLGEQTRELLTELGYSASAIDELHARGVVKTETLA